MKETFDPLLDGLSELVYISDPETYKLLYINKAGEDIYGEGVVDGTHLCYETLQGQDAPCPFCTNALLSADSFYQWEFTNPTRGRHYLLRDRLIPWKGKLVRLEIAFDVTEQEKERERLRFLNQANAVTLDCIKLISGNEDLPSALEQTLARMGTFCAAERAHVCKIEDGLLSVTYEWCAQGVAPKIDMAVSLADVCLAKWSERLLRGEAVVIGGTEALTEEECCLLDRLGARMLVTAPLLIDGELMGLLCLENPQLGDCPESATLPIAALAQFISSRSRREIVQRRVADLTWNDHLTGALSRAAFHRDCDRGPFDGLGFALIDADRLTSVNHERGRDEGDAVLCGIVSQVKAVFGQRVYRIGDDEFCAVADGVEYGTFTSMVAQAVSRLADCGLAASAGMAWSAHCRDIEALMDLAQQRMYDAKRGRHRAADLGIDLTADEAVNGLLRPGGAKQAVDAGLFDVYLMPQTAGDTGQLVGAEALIRYIDERRNVCALPLAFIPALEDMGDIAHVDFFALSRACETIARWKREGRAVVPLSVNFSRLTVEVEGFVDYVSSTVSSYGVDPSFVEIEVTESARESSSGLLRTVADELRARGFRVAIDDFGVDNANFSLFAQMEFDVLKFDKSLIWGLSSDGRLMKVFRGLAGICSDMGIESVVEGVETEEQMDALKAAGCTRAQGYLVGRPMPIEDFERDFLDSAC